MTTAQLETLREKVLALPALERAELASDLVASLDGPADPNLSEAWDVEICRRINEIEKPQIYYSTQLKSWRVPRRAFGANEASKNWQGCRPGI